VGNDGQFERLCRELGLGELAADPLFATNEARVANRSQLVPLLRSAFGQDSRDAWLARLRAAGVPAAPVNTLPEALADEQAVARGMVGELRHPTAGPLPAVLSPFGQAAAGASRPPPLLGQHNLEVLAAELNLTEAEVLELERARVLVREPAH
jgi:crotonobetainyl-CoA:carnitine CoA-transferase CaiB-like acyl-CoA transferase